MTQNKHKTNTTMTPDATMELAAKHIYLGQQIDKLKAELAEANEKNEKLWAEIQAMNTIPIAKVQWLNDMVKKEMEIAHKANTENGNQSWQTLNMIRIQLDKLLSSEGKEKGQ